MTGSEYSKRAQKISESISRLLLEHAQWQAQWEEYTADKSLDVPQDQMESVLNELLERLKENYPFFHPGYAGQMLKPPHPVASIAYFLTQQINPNNHALDGGPATARMEQEVVADLARMFGYSNYLGHLTSSGTIANLEALWIARSLHPDKVIAFSGEAHYTHRRMCDVIGARYCEIACDPHGRMDMTDLRAQLKAGSIGTVVMTAGTTGLGAVDPIHDAILLQREFDFRIHVDGAYGGFFKLLTDIPQALNEPDRLAFEAIAHTDSVVVDPHKHGLQPYGCGSVIFRDPLVGRFYKHDSPYTYFTSRELHLGEISLECSRAGAAAAALWATLRVLPLKSASGLGGVLQQTRLAAQTWSKLITADSPFCLVTDPSLDIVAFYPKFNEQRVSVISQWTNQLFEDLMHSSGQPVYLAKMRMKPARLCHHPDLIWDQSEMDVLRSVLMKPEHLSFVPHLHQRLCDAFARIIARASSVF